MDQIAEPKQVAQNSGMPDPATKLQSLSLTAGRIESEQPLTERMRTFLRIELLHRQACFHSQDATELGTRAAISSLLEILTILSRADVRADVVKELERQGKVLVSFARRPGVDPARLQGFVDELHALQEDLANCSPKFIAPLKECDFLNNIKHRSSIPGGTCLSLIHICRCRRAI